MGSSAGAPDPSAPDPVADARRRLVEVHLALLLESLPAFSREQAESELGEALEEFVEAVIRRWLGEL